jgi:hypothetical protein
MIGEAQKNGVELTEFSVNEKNQVRFAGKKKGSVDDINKFIGKLEENTFIKEPQFGGSQTSEDKIEFKFTAMLGIPKPEKESGTKPGETSGQPPSEAPAERPGAEPRNGPAAMPPSQPGTAPEKAGPETPKSEPRDVAAPPSSDSAPRPVMRVMRSGSGETMRMEDLPPEIRERMAREMERAREERGTP